MIHKFIYSHIHIFSAHSVELGRGFFSQDWKLYGLKNEVFKTHRQFRPFAPQVQNEIAVQTPRSQNGR